MSPLRVNPTDTNTQRQEIHIVSTPCGRAKTCVHVPLGFPPGPGPPSGASLGGPTMGQIGWGGPSTGPTLFFGAAGVSPCRSEPLRAGCCGGEGVLSVS